jgi:hypothetical protein
MMSRKSGAKLYSLRMIFKEPSLRAQRAEPSSRSCLLQFVLASGARGAPHET